MELTTSVELGLSTEWGDWHLTVCEWSDGVTTVEADRKVIDGPADYTEYSTLTYYASPSIMRIREDLDAWEQGKAEAAFEAWIAQQHRG